MSTTRTACSQLERVGAPVSLEEADQNKWLSVQAERVKLRLEAHEAEMRALVANWLSPTDAQGHPWAAPRNQFPDEKHPHEAKLALAALTPGSSQRPNCTKASQAPQRPPWDSSASLQLPHGHHRLTGKQRQQQEQQPVACHSPTKEPSRMRQPDSRTRDQLPALASSEFPFPKVQNILQRKQKLLGLMGASAVEASPGASQPMCTSAHRPRRSTGCQTDPDCGPVLSNHDSPPSPQLPAEQLAGPSGAEEDAGACGRQREEHFRELREWRQRRRHAATIIQAGVRGFLCRLHHREDAASREAGQILMRGALRRCMGAWWRVTLRRLQLRKRLQAGAAGGPEQAPAAAYLKVVWQLGAARRAEALMMAQHQEGKYTGLAAQFRAFHLMASAWAVWLDMTVTT